MINETIKQVLYKGEDDRYPVDYPVIQTDKGIYLVDLGGFSEFGDRDMSGYHPYQKDNLVGLKITEIFANGSDMYVCLSDNRVIMLGVAEGGLEFLVEEYEQELKDWFYGPEPKESDIQRLTKDHPHIQRPK